jgi:hypothetical protein
MDALNEIMFRTALATADISKYSILNFSITDSWTSYYEANPVCVYQTTGSSHQKIIMY